MVDKTVLKSQDTFISTYTLVGFRVFDFIDSVQEKHTGLNRFGKC